MFLNLMLSQSMNLGLFSFFLLIFSLVSFFFSFPFLLTTGGEIFNLDYAYTRDETINLDSCSIQVNECFWIEDSILSSCQLNWEVWKMDLFWKIILPNFYRMDYTTEFISASWPICLINPRTVTNQSSFIWFQSLWCPSLNSKLL